MSSDQTGKPPPKNSLLSAAATGFSFEDSAALLVPVSLQDESATAISTTEFPAATAEIDLNSEDDGTHVDLMAPSLVPVTGLNSHHEETHTSALFPQSNVAANDDPFLRLIPDLAPLTLGIGSSSSSHSDLTYSSPMSTLVSPSQSDPHFYNSQNQNLTEEPKVSQAKESFFSFGSFFSNAAKVPNFFSSSANNATNNPQQIGQSSTSQGHAGSQYSYQTTEVGSQYPYQATAAGSPYMVSPPLITERQNELPQQNISGVNVDSLRGNSAVQQFPPPHADVVPTNITPVPLMTASEVASALPPVATSSSSSNNFRLKTQKRLSYAQYPGLTGSSNIPPIPAADIFPTGLPVLPQMAGYVDTPPLQVMASAAPLVATPITSSSVTPPPLSTFTPEPARDSPSQSMTTLQSAFAPHYAVTSQPTFAPQSAFVPQPSIPPQSAFVPQPSIPPQSAFVPQPSIAPQSVYTPQPTQSSGTPQPAFAVFTPLPTVTASQTVAGNNVPSTNTAVQQQPQQQQSSAKSAGGPPNIASQAAKKVYHPPKVYTPLRYHWFHRKDVGNKIGWKAFSMLDSDAIEKAFLNKSVDPVPTEGGRYDVDLTSMQKLAVYWEEAACEVKRCSWFYKGPLDSRFVPYDEEICTRLENEYADAFATGKWNRRLKFPNGEAITLHNPGAMAHICRAAAPDEWGNVPEDQLRPRVVKRGVDEFDVERGESPQIDHLVLLVHGIGAICDFKFRSIVEAVDGFRNMSFPLMRDHFKEAVEAKKAGRVEFLPISWHKALHGEGGIDDKLKSITLKSIPLLRSFTNDTLLDILFYTSPIYAQNIIDTVGNEMNRIFNLFLSRNPGFDGHVAIAGHSLGSLILFDLLTHQSKSGKRNKEKSESKYLRNSEENDKLSESNASGVPLHSNESVSRLVSYTFGPVGNGTGQPQIMYPVLEFEPTAFFALGSPIAMFVTIRGIEILGKDFHFPTCPAFFNIFHPFDPVAYRIETLIDNKFDFKPVLIPHHKGRKRLHLELKETMQRIGSDVKQKVVESVVATWNMLTYYTSSKTPEEIKATAESEKLAQENEVNRVYDTDDDDGEQDIGLGRLNGGRRVDCVLQEAPLESFNEYLFALSSHVCYWESEDTMLMILKEIYASMGIQEDKPRPNSAVNDPVPAPTPAGMVCSNDAPPNSSAAYPAMLPVSDASDSHPPTTVLYSRAGPMQAFPSPVTSFTPPIMFNPNCGRADQSLIGPSPSLPPIASPPGPPETMRKPVIIGARPVVSSDILQNLRGMDPTAPINTGHVGPPPLAGFKPKQ